MYSGEIEEWERHALKTVKLNRWIKNEEIQFHETEEKERDKEAKRFKRAVLSLDFRSS